VPDPRYTHCPECAGGRVNCGVCDGEGIVEVSDWRARWLATLARVPIEQAARTIRLADRWDHRG
jgi:hypothetical protein